MNSIKYTKSKTVNEEIDFEIFDERNCFIEARSKYNNTLCYLGIYKTKLGLNIVQIDNNIVSYEHNANKNVYTSANIKHFLERNNNPINISERDFKKRLYSIIELLKFDEEIIDDLVEKDNENE